MFLIISSFLMHTHTPPCHPREEEMFFFDLRLSPWSTTMFGCRRTEEEKNPQKVVEMLSGTPSLAWINRQ